MNDKVKNVEDLRLAMGNQVELRHRCDGKTMSFPLSHYSEEGMKNSGYLFEDWIPANKFTAPEGPDYPTLEHAIEASKASQAAEAKKAADAAAKKEAEKQLAK